MAKLLPVCYVCEKHIHGLASIMGFREGPVQNQDEESLPVKRHRDDCAPGTRAWARRFPDSYMAQFVKAAPDPAVFERIRQAKLDKAVQEEAACF